MNETALLKKAKDVRETEHRLKPSLRLKTLDEIVDFIHSRGLVSMLGGNELPSLVSALLGRPWKPTGKGFTSWLDWWNVRVSGKNAGHLLMDIPRRKDIIGTRIFRNSKTYVSNRVWPLLDVIVMQFANLAKKQPILSPLESTILETLSGKGPTRTDKLRASLKLLGKQNSSRFHRSLTRLENKGLIIGYEDPEPETHLHAAIWQTWRQRWVPSEKTTHATSEEAFAHLLETTIGACVMVREDQITKWYPWNGNVSQAKEKLVATGKILRAGPFLVTARII